MAKKEKSAEDRVMKLLTKLNTLYRSDCSIIDGIKVIPGPVADASNSGIMYVDLDPEYITAVKEIFGVHKEIYIDNLKEAKLDWEKHIKITEENEFNGDNKAFKYINTLNEVFRRANDWKMFKDLTPEKSVSDVMASVVFEKQSVYRFEPKESGGIMLTKQMFPTILFDAVDATEFSFGKISDTVQILYLSYNNDIGKVYIAYAYLDDSGLIKEAEDDVSNVLTTTNSVSTIES